MQFRCDLHLHSVWCQNGSSMIVKCRMMVKGWGGTKLLCVTVALEPME